jgi:hypothetical protein
LLTDKFGRNSVVYASTTMGQLQTFEAAASFVRFRSNDRT